MKGCATVILVIFSCLLIFWGVDMHWASKADEAIRARDADFEDHMNSLDIEWIDGKPSLLGVEKNRHCRTRRERYFLSYEYKTCVYADVMSTLNGMFSIYYSYETPNGKIAFIRKTFSMPKPWKTMTSDGQIYDKLQKPIPNEYGRKEWLK